MKLSLSLLILLGLIVITATMIPTGNRQPQQGGYGEAQVGGHFSLTDSSGKPVSDRDFAGRFMLIYLGYAHCPDICPATLSMMGDVLKALGGDADKISVIFITVDPQNDTPVALAEYLKPFDSRIVGLTGSKEAIEQVVRAFKGSAKKADNPGPGNMLISHSGLIYLMDREGKYISHFESDVKRETLLQAIRAQF